jgi:hypothetical protein
MINLFKMKMINVSKMSLSPNLVGLNIFLFDFDLKHNPNPIVRET